MDGEPTAGAWTRVLSADGDVLGYGHLAPLSPVRVRLLSFGKDADSEDRVSGRIGAAVEHRTALPLVEGTDALRLINAEADGLPGLVADRYGDVVVAQLSSAGMVARREEVAAALRETTGAGVGFERADTWALRREGVPARQGPLWGELPDEPVVIRERGRSYRVDVEAGQRTGFYLDRRDARDLVEKVARGRRALDLFAYTGGFAVAAARGGAAELRLVESSARAAELARDNLVANGAGASAAVVHGDALRFLRDEAGEYDLVVLDPPPLARHKREISRALHRYGDLLRGALRRSSPAALLLVLAGSDRLHADDLRRIASDAASRTGRALRVLAQVGPPADHPLDVGPPHGAALDGLLLQA